jgi:hypothetical protein
MEKGSKYDCKTTVGFMENSIGRTFFSKPSKSNLSKKIFYFN